MTNDVVMAAFSQKHVDLTYQATKSLLQHNPKLEVDLFTDVDKSMGPFSWVHIQQDAGICSKVDAIRQSRFDRTLYLDVDLLVLADLSDLFEVLDKLDIAATHDQYRNSALERRMYREPIANAFPQINAGVLAFRKTEPVIEFLQDWKNEIKAQGIGKDQPSLRELLWKKGLKLAVLPPEYNLWHLSIVDRQEPRFHLAPRILHSSVFRGCLESAPGSQFL